MKVYGLSGGCAIAYFLTMALGDAWDWLGWIGFILFVLAVMSDNDLVDARQRRRSCPPDPRRAAVVGPARSLGHPRHHTVNDAGTASAVNDRTA
jgi:hypothetical protein